VARQRVLPLPEVTSLKMKHTRNGKQPPVRPTTSPGKITTWYSSDPYGKLQDPRSWSKKFKRIAQAAGIDITFHKLRHDHASRLSENGASIKDAQYRLGHSTTQMLLNVYTHRISGGQEKIATWLNSSFPAAQSDHETPLN
jgi:integrase